MSFFTIMVVVLLALLGVVVIAVCGYFLREDLLKRQGAKRRARLRRRGQLAHDRFSGFVIAFSILRSTLKILSWLASICQLPRPSLG